MRLDEPAWWYRDHPGSMAMCLAPLAAAYGWAAATRYAQGRQYRSRLPVVCIGNFTAGGTGKTPLVLHACEHLRSIGRHPVALTRGYGGRRAGPHWVSNGDTSDDVGDEALLLAREVPTLIARDRGAGARMAEAAENAPDVLVMDDGLQNPSLAKDLSIVTVDGSRGLGNGLVIPAGPLRAPLDFQLELADAIVVNGASGEHVSEWLRHRFGGPVLRAFSVVAGDAAWLRGQRIVAWAGIASPQRFFATLGAHGADVVERVTFRDHQRLAEADAERLLALATRREAQLVSTEKDMARLEGASGKRAELAANTKALPVKLSFPQSDAERFIALIDGALKKSVSGAPQKVIGS